MTGIFLLFFVFINLFQLKTNKNTFLFHFYKYTYKKYIVLLYIKYIPDKVKVVTRMRKKKKSQKCVRMHYDYTQFTSGLIAIEYIISVISTIKCITKNKIS